MLAGSSLLHAWGNAGAYTLIAELVPDEDRVTGNALLSTFSQAPRDRPGPGRRPDRLGRSGLGDRGRRRELGGARGRLCHDTVHATDAADDRSGDQRRPRHPRRSPAPGLLAVTCLFFFLYGPVEVALPVHIAREISGSAALLGLFWAFFGVGAILGGLSAGLLRHRPLWTVVAVIIIGWGASLLPLGLTDAVLPGLVGFAVGGLIYGPFTAICTALFQRSSPPHLLSSVLATRTALTTPSTALGTLLGGPLVAAVGGRHTLLASAVLTIALGVAVAVASRRS